MENLLPFIDRDSLALLRPKLQLARAREGQYLVREGKPSPGLFIVQDGTVDILRSNGGHELFILSLEKDSLFGESAFLGGVSASASARARSQTDLLVMSPQKLQPLFEENPKLFSQFYRSLALHLSRKLRRATGDAGAPRNVDRFGDLPSWEIL